MELGHCVFGFSIDPGDRGGDPLLLFIAFLGAVKP